MEKKISVLSIFMFLLFAVSSPSLFSDPVPSNGASKPSLESGSNVIVFLNKKQKLDLDETFGVLTIDQMANVNSVELLPIKKATLNPLLSLGRRLVKMFEKKIMVPQTKILYGKNVIYSMDLQRFNKPVPTRWVEFKHNGDIQVGIFG
ncbi:hypothetical protein L1987_72119 [Smallanthus sonchifolius]|uniref:Uncharacterized protein n=1 Tax=Smallanthus sonchifolius TaxID=185202 RepID=A0ACB9AUC7_9ASTR|nr:hypothetical protein L1987_72119 [Smallanthus sonchifolius]